MKSVRGLGRKLHRLEARVGINQPSDLPEDLQAFHIFYQKEGQPDEEIDAEVEKKKQELVEKYGQRIQNKLNMLVFQIVSANGMRGQNTAKKGDNGL